jgi:hypothetical protein
VHLSINLSQRVAKAAKINELRGRARARGVEDFRCECGHGKGSRASILAPALSGRRRPAAVDELEQLKLEDQGAQSECARVASFLRDEIVRPLESWEHGRRLLDAIAGRATARPTIKDAGLVHKKE